MLADRRTLVHPAHGPVDTPMLVPAFSSKGFRLPYSTKLGHDYSEVGYIVHEFPTYEAGSVLISAYDLHYKHFEMPDEGMGGDVVGKVTSAEVVLIDSGGYELTRDFDTSQIKSYQYEPKAEGYCKEVYEELLTELCSGRTKAPLVISNYDYTAKNTPYGSQVEAARRLFEKYEDVACTFILKPWGERDSRLHLDELSSRQIAELRDFDAIGVTEKELGRSLLDRLRAIAELRVRLSEASVDIPIHVWGGLDPILTPLYFFAGADIFDGLSWLRYGFVDGMAVNREASQVLVQSLNARSSRQHVEYYLSMSNCQVLERLEVALAQWVDYDGERFDVFGDNVAERVKRAYDEIAVRIPDIGGAR